MRLTASTLLALGAALPASAHSNNPTPTPTTASWSTLPASTDASSYLSEVYKPFGGVPPQVTGAIATTLASSLFSLEKSWETHTMASSNNAAIWSAAARDTQASAVLESLDKSGYNYGLVTTNAWYNKYVPDDVRGDVAAYNSAWESVFVNVVITGVESTAAPTATATSTSAATSSISTAAAAAGPARATGYAVAVAAGAVGVVLAGL